MYTQKIVLLLLPVLGVEIISNFFVSYLLNSLQAAWITLIIIKKKKTIFILINKAQKGTNNPVLVDTTSHYYLA